MSSSKFNLFWQQQEQTICLPPPPTLTKKGFPRTPSLLPVNNFRFIEKSGWFQDLKLPNATLHPFPPPLPPKKKEYL